MSGPSRLALSLAAWLGRAAARAPTLSFRIVEKFSHQRRCFTEGLFLNGSQHEVFESCGLYGRSYLRRYSLRTGETLQTAKVPAEIFSEGLTLLGERIYMLTYRAHKVLEFDARSFRLSPRTHPFPFGEGWGLTTDGCDLLATTGSSYLFRLRPGPSGVLKLVSKVQVTHGGWPLSMLNELEYITPKLWVNQWLTNTVWRIDPRTGKAEAQISLKGLHNWHGDDTPNGLAYSTALGKEILLVTGKQWPHMFSLHMSPGDLCGGPTASAPSCPAAPASACWNSQLAKAAPASVAAAGAGSHDKVSGGGAAAGSTAAAGSPPAISAAAVPGAAAPKGATPAPRGAPREPLLPLPTGVTAVSTLLAAAACVAAVAAPLYLRGRRRRYKLAAQRADPEGSA